MGILSRLGARDKEGRARAPRSGKALNVSARRRFRGAALRHGVARARKTTSRQKRKPFSSLSSDCSLALCCAGNHM
jgi:hypothetical protein